MCERSAQNHSQHRKDQSDTSDPRACVSEIESIIEMYLRVLRRKVANTTYLSHQTALTEFISLCRDQGCIDVPLTEECIAQFTTRLLTTASHKISTISGYVYTLANFIAYLKQSDPEIVKARIVAEFDCSTYPRLDAVKSHMFPELACDSGPGSTPRSAVEALVSYLRQRQFGTRTHAFVEVLLDTKSRLGPIQQLNISDLNFEKNALVVDVPDTHLVGSTGLVTERITWLTPRTTDALKMYITHERKGTTRGDTNPLFTTSHGRATDSTLRRSIKQACESAAAYSLSQTTDPEIETEVSSSEEYFQKVVPSDIRRHAISEIIE